MKVPFNQNNLGFYHVDDFAEHLGVTSRCVRGWVENGSSDTKYAVKIKHLHDYCQFPIDIPPFPVDVLGYSAFNAFHAIKENNAEFAELITSKALSSGIDWEWGSKRIGKLTPLQEVYCILANALSWQRHANKDYRKEGLKQLLSLRSKLKRLIKLSPDTKETNVIGKPWEYALMMVSVRIITYIAIDKADYVRNGKFYKNNLCRAIRKLQTSSKIYPKSNLCALINWNATQFAAIDNDDALFIMGLDSLNYKYGSHFKVILKKLYNDDDTKIMLKHERIQNYCSEIN